MKKVAKSIQVRQDPCRSKGAEPFVYQGVSSSADQVPALDTTGDLTTANPSTPLQKRARRKAVGHPLAKALMEVADGNLMGNGYRRTYYQCGQVLDQKDGKVRQYFCAARWCPVCASIRTAKAFQSYGAEVQSWTDAYMVTLTIPNVFGHQLRRSVQDMHKAFRNIWRVMAEKQGIEVKAIRATECTFSTLRHQRGLPAYHPHMHLIVKGKDVAERFVQGWLKRFPEAKRAAQDIRKANGGSVAELFKYSCKLISDKRSEDGGRDVVPVIHLHAIFTAFRRLRLWQVVGIRAAVREEDGDDTAELEYDTGTTATKRITERVAWEWNQSVRDWVDFETGEVLTGYRPSERWDAFIKKVERLAPD